TEAEAQGPVPTYECEFRIGQPVRIAKPAPGEDAGCEFRIGQPVRIAKPAPGEDAGAIYYVTGIEWEHRMVPQRGWDITIASREDIERGNGQTDGYAPSDLLPALAQEGK